MRLRPKVIQGKASAELRRLLREEPRPIVSVGGGTAHHAQLAEATGFRLFGLSGSQASAHILGLPDAGLMTMSEVVENARRICQSVSIPVLADCETGFGNVLNTTRAVSELIDAGVAGRVPRRSRTLGLLHAGLAGAAAAVLVLVGTMGFEKPMWARVLLVCAGLFLRSLQQAATIDPGFDADNVAIASFDLRAQGYDEARGRAFYANLAERLAGLPDVHYGDDQHWVAGNLGVSTWLLTGTNNAGEQIRVRGVDLLEFRDGKVTKKDSYWKIVAK